MYHDGFDLFKDIYDSKTGTLQKRHVKDCGKN